MDIERPDIKQKKRRRQIIAGIVVALIVVAAVVALRRLKPASPDVERSTVWTDTVKRGAMLRQVRGLGTLVPREDRLRLIPSQTDGTVVRILVLPGARSSPTPSSWSWPAPRSRRKRRMQSCS